MNDISHSQAQSLIRQSLDRTLPHRQWTTLQGHLEHCGECQSYREQMTQWERTVRRALRAGWSATPGPAADTPNRVLVGRQAVQRWQRRSFYSLAGTAALLIFYLLGGFERLFAPQMPAQAPAPLPTPSATPIATPQAGEFRGVVLFDAVTADGKRALYLLNPVSGAGPEPLLDPQVPVTGAGVGEAGRVNNDSDPAWSPDGEWLAFLSDRGSATVGKQELMVSNVAGSRVVQLTADENILWEGPLTWSADGQWLALAGVRTDQGGQRWIYRVPVNMERTDKQLAAVAGSRNGFSPEFAPYGDGLAYGFRDGSKSGVVIDHLSSGERVSANWLVNPLAALPGQGAAFDWSQDGAGLAYIAPQPPAAAGPDGSQVVAVRDLNYSITLFYDLLHNFQVARSRWPGAFRGVTWTPGGAIVYLEDLDDARANDQPGQTTSGCWTLQVRMVGFRGSDSRTVPLSNLCVESPIDRSSWTPDGRWLVVLGRTVDEMISGSPRGIYAVYIPQQGDTRLEGKTPEGGTPSGNPLSNQAAEPYLLRLGSVDGTSGTPRVRPALRGYAEPLQIDPQPALRIGLDTSQRQPERNSGNRLTDLLGLNLGQTANQPSDVRQARGQIYFSHQQGNGSVIARMNPDGTGGRLLFASDGQNNCPSPSPDGRWLAFVSDMSNPGTQRPGVRELSGSLDLATPTPDVPSPPAVQALPGDPMPPEAMPGQPEPQLIGHGNELYLMDTDGGGLVQISWLESLPESGPRPGLTITPARYGCPSWAPDGSALAVVIDTPLQWYLGIFGLRDGQLDPNVPRRYLRIEHPAGVIGPQWMANGRQVLLPYLPAYTQDIIVYPPIGQADSRVSDMATRPVSGQPRLLSVSVPEDARQELVANEIRLETGWDGFSGLSVSPGGQEFGWLALSSLSAESEQGEDHSLVMLGLAGVHISLNQARMPLGVEYSDQPVRFNQLNWLTPSQMGLALRWQPDGAVKALIGVFNLSTRQVTWAARVPDRLYDLAWSPDGRWLIYASESGLWVLDVQAALNGKAGPVWISPQPVEHLSWR